EQGTPLVGCDTHGCPAIEETAAARALTRHRVEGAFQLEHGLVAATEVLSALHTPQAGTPVAAFRAEAVRAVVCSTGCRALRYAPHGFETSVQTPVQRHAALCVRSNADGQQRCGEQSFLHLLLHTLSKSKTSTASGIRTPAAPDRKLFCREIRDDRC